jgi:hypothetical protein
MRAFRPTACLDNLSSLAPTGFPTCWNRRPLTSPERAGIPPRCNLRQLTSPAYAGPPRCNSRQLLVQNVPPFHPTAALESLPSACLLSTRLQKIGIQAHICRRKNWETDSIWWDSVEHIHCFRSQQGFRLVSHTENWLLQPNVVGLGKVILVLPVKIRRPFGKTCKSATDN